MSEDQHANGATVSKPVLEGETERFASALLTGSDLLLDAFKDMGFDAQTLSDRPGWRKKFERRLDVLMKDLFPIRDPNRPMNLPENLSIPTARKPAKKKAPAPRE